MLRREFKQRTENVKERKGNLASLRQTETDLLAVTERITVK